MRRLALLAVLLLALTAAPANASVGDVRLLVVRLTWGPPVPSEQELRAALDEANAFFVRASFGRASIRGDVTPVVTGFVVPPACLRGSNEDTGLGALSVAARAAAERLGYDLRAYDRFVYVFPDRVCARSGLGVGRDVLLAGGDVSGGLVHELGHTFRLPHAGSAACATCAIREYGDADSVMGHGGYYFNAWEKAQLGWIDNVRRIGASGTYELTPVDVPGAGPHALLLRVAAGTLWIERRLDPVPRVFVRIVKRPPGGGAVRSIVLARGSSVATVPYLVRVRSTAGGVAVSKLRPR